MRRRPVSTISAARGRSESCRISTICCFSEPRSPAIPWRVSREMRDGRCARIALCQEADRAEDPDHDRRHELRLAVRQRQGSARPWRYRDGHLDDDGRRRHDPGGAATLQDACLSASAVTLWHESRRFAQGGRHRGGRRPGRQTGRRRHAARPEDHRARGEDADAAGRDRSALRVPAS